MKYDVIYHEWEVCTWNKTRIRKHHIIASNLDEGCAGLVADACKQMIIFNKKYGDRITIKIHRR